MAPVPQVTKAIPYIASSQKDVKSLYFGSLVFMITMENLCRHTNLFLFRNKNA